MKRTELAKRKGKKIESRVARGPAAGSPQGASNGRKDLDPNSLVAKLLRQRVKPG